MIVCLLSSCSSENYNSVNIDKNDLNDIKITPFDSVIEFYYMVDSDGEIALFDFNNSIPQKTGKYLYKHLSMNRFSKVIRVGENGEPYDQHVHHSVLDNYCKFFSYAIDYEKILGYSSKVENVYCYIIPGLEKLFIRYETDRGTYVLFSETDSKIYLFPMNEDFMKITAKWEEIVSNNGSMDGGIELASVTDISEYEITPRLLSWDGIIMIATAFACIAISVTLIVVKKRKNRN